MNVGIRDGTSSLGAQRAGRATREGMVHAYIHPGSRIGVLIEVNCETDFVARTDEFKQLTKDLAMQVAATSPLFIRREEVPEDLLNSEREIYRNQALQSGKPEKVLDRIVEGKLNDYYSKVCLLEQPFVKDPSLSVGELLTRASARIGEKLEVRRFSRFQVGEK